MNIEEKRTKSIQSINEDFEYIEYILTTSCWESELSDEEMIKLDQHIGNAWLILVKKIK